MSLVKAKSHVSFQPVGQELATFLVRGEQQRAPTAAGALQGHAEQPATRSAGGSPLSLTLPLVGNAAELAGIHPPELCCFSLLKGD